MWITDTLYANISIIDVTTKSTSIINTSTYFGLQYPQYICYDGEYMWLSDYDASKIVIFEIFYPYAIINTISDETFGSMVLDNINNNMWVLDQYSPSFYIINIETYVITTISVSASLLSGGIGFDETYIWIIYNSYPSPYIDLYTASTQTYHSTLTKNYGFSTINNEDLYGFAYQDNNMWIVSLDNNVLSIVNTTTYDLIATYSGMAYDIVSTASIAYDSINNKMWMIDFSNSQYAYILDNITNPVTGYSVKLGGVETDLSLIFKSISLGTKSTTQTNYNVSGYGDLNNIFAALDGGTPLTYNTLYTINVGGDQKDLSEIFLPL